MEEDPSRKVRGIRWGVEYMRGEGDCWNESME